MSSPKKTTPTASPPVIKSALRPFSRRQSSDLTSVNADLKRQILDLQTQLESKTIEVNEANRRARQAEEREAVLKEIAGKFWKDEWSGMKEYVGLFNNGDVKRDIEDIEERILIEYSELFRKSSDWREGSDGR